jgi:protein Tex
MTAMLEALVVKETGISSRAVEAVLSLSASGATVPFIARYRKEATGELDEEQIRLVLDRAEKIEALHKRRHAILDSLAERDLLTEELKRSLEGADTISRLEDLYLPFRPKRKTRAMAATERGLAPLAAQLISGGCSDPLKDAAAYVDPERGIDTAAEALSGARDILAENFCEHPELRGELRLLFKKKALLSSEAVKKSCKEKPREASRFSDYFQWSESARKAAGHRILAIRRGDALGFLRMHLLPPEDDALLAMKRLCMRVGGVQSPAPGEKKSLHIPLTGEAAREVSLAVEDGYKRLLSSALENELKAELVAAAEAEAISRFGRNLRELLLQSPFGARPVLALDPGLRTGTKVVVLDSGGVLLTHDVIYPLAPHHKKEESAARIQELCSTYGVKAIAVGNGTGGRELEDFLRQLPLAGDVEIVSVDESGASVYSASPLARSEFPDHDVTVRGAVSIGRRLQDPLSELVKIDPKAIGVGEYQHDVDQKALRKSLDETVESCVNSVGVELNSASAPLLSYVSGIGEKLALRIAACREAHGPFSTRQKLLEVPGLGPKVFEQAAGFLRIRDGAEPLDASAVHPERYNLVRKMAADAGVKPEELFGSDNSVREAINLQGYLDDKTGMATLQDIMAELEKPGRDPRKAFENFRFSEEVHEIGDLREGMALPGIVTNITAFGAFVDIGVHQDGLVHISQMADHFVKDPADVVKLKQRVQVRVVSVDPDRRRIALSMRSNNEGNKDIKGAG